MRARHPCYCELSVDFRYCFASECWFAFGIPPFRGYALLLTQCEICQRLLKSDLHVMSRGGVKSGKDFTGTCNF